MQPNKLVVPSAGLFLAAAAALLSSACGRSAQVEARTTTTGEVPVVAVARTVTQDLSHSLVMTAEFKPFQEIDVMAKVAGFVKQINVDVGDRVRQGQLLATLEIPEMTDDITRAQASGAKSDPSDTDSLLDLLLRHRERLRPLRPETVETRLLHFLVEERRQTVDEKTRASLRLTDCLRLYFPQVLRWFDDGSSPVVGDLLERWPTLEQLQRVHPGTLRRFFHEHNCRNEEKNAERMAAIQQATSAAQDQAVRKPVC